MIRPFKTEDMDAILDIWLRASTEAHDFVERGFWESELENMRNIYIPASENYVYEADSQIIGFYSLHENTLAAIFVAPEHQGNGVGSVLISHAKTQRTRLELTVYKKNSASYGFYLSKGFIVVDEQIDQHTGQAEYLMYLEEE